MRELIEKLTSELIAQVQLATNNMCIRIELYDMIIRRLYWAKNNQLMDGNPPNATYKTRSSESSERSWPVGQEGSD